MCSRSKNIADVLTGYDNEETRDWLSQFLLSVGFEKEDGELAFSIESCPGFTQLQQIVARFNLCRAKEIVCGDEQFTFSASESIRVFFSNRYTKQLFRSAFELNGFDILGDWISENGYEGIIACKIKSP